MVVPRSNAMMAEVAKAKSGDRRQAILVLGMHRSGTSALTGLLGLFGADLPKHLMEPNFANRTGYWEPADIVAIHDTMLAAIGSAWDDAAEFPLAWLETPAAHPFKARLREAFEEAFGASSLAVLKDPRICRFVPLWTSILEEMGVEPLFVIPVRSPLEVAASLRVREEETAATRLHAGDRMPEAKALLLWLRHFLDAERHSRGFARSFVSYEKLLADWRGTVIKMGCDLGIEWPGSAEEAARQVENFLSRELRHHVSAADTVTDRPDIVPWLKDTFRWAQNAAAGRLEDTSELDRIHAALRLTDLASSPIHGGLNLAERADAPAFEWQTAEQVEIVAKRLGGEPTMAQRELRRIIAEIAGHFTEANQTFAHALGAASVLRADLARRLEEASLQIAALLAAQEVRQSEAIELENLRAAAAELEQQRSDLAEEIRTLRADLGQAVIQRDAMRQLFRRQGKTVASLRAEQLEKVRLQERAAELGKQSLELERRNLKLERRNEDLARINADLDQRATEFEQRSFFFEQQCELFHARNLKIAQLARYVPAPVRHILKRLLSRAGSMA